LVNCYDNIGHSLLSTISLVVSFRTSHDISGHCECGNEYFDFIDDDIAVSNHSTSRTISVSDSSITIELDSITIKADQTGPLHEECHFSFVSSDTVTASFVADSTKIRCSKLSVTSYAREFDCLEMVSVPIFSFTIQCRKSEEVKELGSEWESSRFRRPQTSDKWKLFLNVTVKELRGEIEMRLKTREVNTEDAIGENLFEFLERIRVKYDLY
jgi:hypothetical protein